MWTEVCGRKFVDGSCGPGGGDSNIKKVGVLARLVSLRGQFQNSRRASPPFLYIESPPGSCGRKLWTVDGNDFRSSLLGRDRPYGAQNDK